MFFYEWSCHVSAHPQPKIQPAYPGTRWFSAHDRTMQACITRDEHGNPVHTPCYHTQMVPVGQPGSLVARQTGLLQSAATDGCGCRSIPGRSLTSQCSAVRGFSPALRLKEGRTAGRREGHPGWGFLSLLCNSNQSKSQRMGQG